MQVWEPVGVMYGVDTHLCAIKCMSLVWSVKPADENDKGQ